MNILAVLFFCKTYSFLYSSMTSSGSFLFLAYFQALLSLDLSLILLKSSESTHVAAFMIYFFFLPGFFLSLLLMVCSTEDLILCVCCVCVCALIYVCCVCVCVVCWV